MWIANYMSSTLRTLLLIFLGYIIGFLLQALVERLEGRKIFKGTAIETSLYAYLIEVFYFAALFSVPLSGNLFLSIIFLGFFLYVLYGTFGAEKLPPKKPEDLTDSKWFRMFP